MRRRTRKAVRFLRHPWRTIDDALRWHYAPDVTPLLQQILDLGGSVNMPVGRWKVSQLALPPGRSFVGTGVTETVIRLERNESVIADLTLQGPPVG